MSIYKTLNFNYINNIYIKLLKMKINIIIIICFIAGISNNLYVKCIQIDKTKGSTSNSSNSSSSSNILFVYIIF